MTWEKCNALRQLLVEHWDVFAKGHKDMSGIASEIIQHCLSVNPKAKGVRHKSQNFSAEKNIAILEEVNHLLSAGFIRDAHYPEWLCNVVLVKKTNGKWRMYVDFTDLNKVCPKDSFPLPCIDLIVDSTASHQMLSFMDAYSRYN